MKGRGRWGALNKAETWRISNSSSVTTYGVESAAQQTKHDTTGKPFSKKSETEKCIVRGASKNGDCLLSSLGAMTLLRVYGRSRSLGLSGVA